MKRYDVYQNHAFAFGLAETHTHLLMCIAVELYTEYNNGL